MRLGILAIFMGLLLPFHVSVAEIRGILLPKCQELANDYAKNPESLGTERLKQLQFCINQSLDQQQTLKPPTMLKGTIIEPLISSENDSSAPTENLGARE